MNVPRTQSPVEPSARPCWTLVPLLVALGCGEYADLADPTPTWTGGIEVLLAKCLPCHAEGASRPSLASFLEVASCTESGEPWAGPAGPIVRALDRDDHQSVLSAPERSTLTRWASRGLVYTSAKPHPPGFAGPAGRPEFHGSILKATQYAKFLDSEVDGTCLQCHGPAREKGGAIPCSSCHGDGLEKSRCGTCHGAGDDPTPVARFCDPDSLAGVGAHTIHLERAATDPFPIVSCPDCHVVPDSILSDGHVGGARADVKFGPRASPAARYEPETMTCSDVSCHFKTAITWTATRSAAPCQVCHGDPPAGHASRSCPSCHISAFDEGDKLRVGVHDDGTLQVGKECDACHSDGPSPALRGRDSGAHAVHTIASGLRDAYSCDECHSVPSEVATAGHIDSDLPAEVTMTSGRGTHGGQLSPDFDQGERTCASVGCHGAHLAGGAGFEARWALPTEPLPCGACHGLPPETVRGGASVHLPTGPAECGACHQTPELESITVGTSSISRTARGSHINGCVDLVSDLGRGCAP
ncbi:MAG: hypothetical protein HY791_25450 [Deltaproteobacteria bacterium]|nr:hypothetical protein [Deltaproteobacteria bacterium]